MVDGWHSNQERVSRMDQMNLQRGRFGDSIRERPSGPSDFPIEPWTVGRKHFILSLLAISLGALVAATWRIDEK